MLTTNYELSNIFSSRYTYSFFQHREDYWGDDREEERKNLQNKFSLSANVVFSDIHYTRKHQKETYFSSNVKFNTDHSKNQTDITQPASSNTVLRNGIIEFSPYFNIHQVNRRYLNENWYVGYSPSLTYQLTARRVVLFYEIIARNNECINKNNEL
jgi:hypothetical protein